MASTIGIKIANGEFYSILEENTIVKKRLVLTTVHDNQQSVHIDLYKSNTATMQSAVYVGSLLVDHIRARLKGEPSIELVIASNEHGEIAADAIDLDHAAATSASGMQASLLRVSETRKLRVSLNELADSPSQRVDFEVEDEATVLDTPAGLYDTPAKKKFPLLLVVIAGLLLIIALFLLWFFPLRESNNGNALAATVVPVEPAAVAPEPEPVVAAVSPEPEPTAEPAPLVPIEEVAVEPEQVEASPAEPPLIEAPVEAPEPPPEPPARIRRIPPVASYKVPTTIPSAGAPYRIRWGDTLWDISEAFYRNPWLYTRIARFNNIRNPDRIVSGTTIRIPPR
jgi:septal ring-binding cell division protein DamX